MKAYPEYSLFEFQIVVKYTSMDSITHIVFHLFISFNIKKRTLYNCTSFKAKVKYIF